jgi:uncharacterized coiled-coil protein SlyX
MATPTDPERQRIAALEAELAACTRDGQRLSHLLAEAEDTSEALEAALHALVDGQGPVYEAEGYRHCPYCAGPDNMFLDAVEHEPDCPVVTARALLGKGDSDGEH